MFDAVYMHTRKADKISANTVCISVERIVTDIKYYSRKAGEIQTRVNKKSCANNKNNLIR